MSPRKCLEMRAESVGPSLATRITSTGRASGTLDSDFFTCSKHAIRRAGAYTLVELIVALAATGVILGLLGVTLQSAIRASTRLNDFEAAAANMTRLEVQFRTDVHQADQISLVGADEADARQMKLILVDTMAKQTQYAYRQGRVERRVAGREGTLHQDAYHIGRDADVQFEFDEVADGRRRVSMTIQCDPTSEARGAGYTRTHRIAAFQHAHTRKLKERGAGE